MINKTILILYKSINIIHHKDAEVENFAKHKTFLMKSRKDTDS